MLYLFAANEYALVEKAINKIVSNVLPTINAFNFVRYDFRETSYYQIIGDAL